MEFRDQLKYVFARVADFILFSIAFFVANFIKRGNLYLTREDSSLFLILLGCGLASSLVTKKYALKKPESLRIGLHPFYRSFVYFAILVFFIIFVLKLFYFSRFMILGTLGIYFALGILAYFIYHLAAWGLNVNVENGDTNGFFPITQEKAEEEIPELDRGERRVKEPLANKLQHEYLQSRPELFQFINEYIKLDKINACDSLLLDADTADSVHSILNDKIEFLANLHKTNDVQRINKFFIAVNQKLKDGAYFVGLVETLEQRLERRYAKYPRLVRKPAHLVDFIWTRVFPKVPGLKMIYFLFNGKDRRILSKSELLGRLYYCGFRIVSMKDIDNTLNYIAKKAAPFSTDKNPSYGPVFKQKRIGKNGEYIYIYKFRTMHPYSEYIHKYIYELNKLDELGKIKDDIRVTTWGRVMRKYWIDELPMLINLLQGDIKLVGMRPLSTSFFSLYPDDLKQLRIQYKPGLIPSLYADVPRTPEEIWASERKYIDKFHKNGRLTDLLYFFKVFYSILFRRARSR